MKVSTIPSNCRFEFSIGAIIIFQFNNSITGQEIVNGAAKEIPRQRLNLEAVQKLNWLAQLDGNGKTLAKSLITLV